MAVLRQCCCGVSLRKGSLLICYWVLATELSTMGVLMLASDNQPTRSIFHRSESSSVRYLQVWTTVFNILVIATALFGIYKHRAPLIIPYLANRTVTIIFSIFSLFNARPIATSLNETLENTMDNERDQTFDTLPLVCVIMIALIALDMYFLLVVYSYYQLLLMSMTMVAVALPIATYSAPIPDNLDSMYSQPSTNPYLIADAKMPSMQHEPYLPTYSYQHYGPAYGGSSSMSNLPPPYRP